MSATVRAAVQCAVLVAATLMGPLPARAESVTKSDTFSAWTVYTDAATPHAFCFVTSEPTAKDPEGATRDVPRIYISAWPKDGVKAEVSFRMGFPVKATASSNATVGDAAFALFSNETRLYVKDATAELKLIDAMKKGASLKVDATSERGTKITDTYSLNGFAQALSKLQADCR